MRKLIVGACLMAVLTASGLIAPSASAAAVPAGATWDEVYFPSFDGTQLHADVLLPAQGCPEGGCPVVVSIGPYYGSGSQGSPVYDPLNAGPSNRFYDFIAHDFEGRGNIFQQGYAWVQADSRGYGGSDGCNDYGGIGEQMDAAAAVEWAGTQPWSNGKVGMWGKSYDGWTQVMALAHNPPHLEATVVQSPLIEGYGIGYVHGVHHDSGWYATTSLYMLYDYLPPSVNEMTPEEAVYPVKGTATDPCWVSQQALILAGWDHDMEYWRERDLRPRASHNDDVAVLWSHGFNDVNTKPDQIFGVYGPLNDLAKSNHRAWFGQWDHVRGNQADVVGRDGFLNEALDWFDHYLKGEPFRYEVNAGNVVEVQDSEGNWRTEAQYPPADVQEVTLELKSGTYADDGSNAATSGYWTASQPLPYDLRISGEPRFTVDPTITGVYANLVAVLYDWDPATGVATEISRSAKRLESNDPVSFTMHPRDQILRAGHQLAVQINAGHAQFFPYSTRTTVTVDAASITIPFLTYERLINLTGVDASANAYTKRPTAAQIAAAAIQMDLPEALIPYPNQEVQESVQPTVTTGAE